MNCYRSVINALGLSPSSQGTGCSHGFIYLICSALADVEDAHPVSNTYSEPFRETLHRLSKYEGHASQIVAQILTPSAMKAAQ